MDNPMVPSAEISRQAGHEMTDASPKTLGLFALGLLLMVALVLPFLTWLFWHYEAEAKRADPPQTPLAVYELPPAPRLEVDPGSDLQRLRTVEEKSLTTYGWIDRQQGVARVPIEQAIDVLAKRGFPEPKAKADQPSKTETAP
jgi:hypothetical protein